MGSVMNNLCKSALTALAFTMLAVLVTACAASTTHTPDTEATTAENNTGKNDDAAAYRATEATVREGLNNISQRYIDPVDMDELALGGLQGLITIDPSLQLKMDKNSRQIYLNRGETHLAQLKAPQPGEKDATNWAHLTAEVLRAGRSHSEDLQNADNERVYEAVFDGMLSNLDIFSRYAGAEEARANRARRDGFGGIGIRFAKSEDSILVTHVSTDSPAFGVGLKPGDVIVRVNDVQMSGAKLRDVAELLRGPVGSQINLTITRLSDDANAPQRTIDFNLKRAHIVPESVRVTIADGLMVITVSSFNKNTSNAVHDALTANDQAIRNGSLQGVIMDLRGNPGGLLSQAVNVADLFLEDGRIIATLGRHPDSQHDYLASGVDLARGLPLTVLVDGDSASAAEIVASALQDLGRAVVIGSASYGKGTVQTVIRLPNDGEVTLTWSRFISPSGYAIHGLGVMPAVCATNTTPAKNPARKNPDSLSDAILTPEHIDGGRNTMDAWRATGLIFDGRRDILRNACPAKTFKADKNGDLLMKLAVRVIHDPAIYQRAVLLSQPVNTASR